MSSSDFVDIMMNASAEKRHSFLIDVNVNLLRQGLELLDRMNDWEYILSPDALPGQRISSHFRHVIEFYECLMRGLPLSRIDYDARRRDAQLEVDRRAAAVRIRILIARLSGDEALLKDAGLYVRVEDAGGAGLQQDFVLSSIGRELQALSSHTVHHFGLIAMLARLLKIPVDGGFGFAPSTLRYRASLRSEAA